MRWKIVIMRWYKISHESESERIFKLVYVCQSYGYKSSVLFLRHSVVHLLRSKTFNSVLYRFRSITSYLLEVANFSCPTFI